MNWKQLLKNKTGFTTGTKFLLTTAGVGALATYTLMGAADQQVQEQRSARALSSMASGTPYAGLSRTEGGSLSSINVRDSRGHLASQADREAIERRQAAHGNFGLDDANNLSAYDIGQAADAAGGYDALTMGSDKGSPDGARLVNTAAAPSASPIANGVYSAGNNGAAAGANASAGYANGSDARSAGSAPQLAGASMARASGSSSASSYNPAAAGGASAPRSAGAGTGSAYQMSGAMPDGSVAMVGGNAPQNSGFTSSRNLTAGQARQNGRGKTELSDIATKSAAAAENASRSANEGGRAFQVGQTGSSGLSGDSLAATGGASSSSDLGTNVNNLRHKARTANINKDAIEAETAYAKKLDKAEKSFNEKFVRNILICLGLITAGLALFNLIKAWRTSWPMGLVYWGLATVFTLAVISFAVGIFKEGAQLMDIINHPPSGVTKPSNSGVIVKDICAGAAIGLMAGVAAFPEFAWDKIKAFGKMVLKSLPSQILGSVKNLFISELKK